MVRMASKGDDFFQYSLNEIELIFWSAVPKLLSTYLFDFFFFNSTFRLCVRRRGWDDLRE